MTKYVFFMCILSLSKVSGSQLPKPLEFPISFKRDKVSFVRLMNVSLEHHPRMDLGSGGWLPGDHRVGTFYTTPPKLLGGESGWRLNHPMANDLIIRGYVKKSP